MKTFLGNIVDSGADAIVNAANSMLEPGCGVCGAIHYAAGPRLAEACRVFVERFGPVDAGEVAITPGYDLKAQFVVHAVGPVWFGGNNGEEQKLRAAYRNSLHKAHQVGAVSIAFPCISTGVFGFPKEEAAGIAITECHIHNVRFPLDIAFYCFSEADKALYDGMLKEMQ
jgi:O-acetyl-ADP-ribose deacetylase (regulator of RNase III)